MLRSVWYVCAFLLGKLPYCHNEHVLCLLYTNASAWLVCLYLLNSKTVFDKWVFKLSMKGNMHFKLRGEKNFVNCWWFQMIEVVLFSETVRSHRRNEEQGYFDTFSYRKGVHWLQRRPNIFISIFQ